MHPNSVNINKNILASTFGYGLVPSPGGGGETESLRFPTFSENFGAVRLELFATRSTEHLLSILTLSWGHGNSNNLEEISSKWTPLLQFCQLHLGSIVKIEYWKYYDEKTWTGWRLVFPALLWHWSIICFRAVQLQWNLPVEPSSPVTSERLLEDTTTDTQYVNTHSDQVAFTFSLLVGSIFSLTGKEVATYSPNVSVRQSVSVFSPEALNQLLSIALLRSDSKRVKISKPNLHQAFCGKKKKRKAN